MVVRVGVIFGCFRIAASESFGSALLVRIFVSDLQRVVSAGLAEA